MAQALEWVIDLDPTRLSRSHVSPVSALQEAIVALYVAAWVRRLYTGHQLGERQEPLIAFVTQQVCQRCAGTGLLWDGSLLRPDGTPAEAAGPCDACEGDGYLDRVALA